MVSFYHRSDINETYCEERCWFLVTLLFVTSLIAWLRLLYGAVPQGAQPPIFCEQTEHRRLGPTALNTAGLVPFVSNN